MIRLSEIKLPLDGPDEALDHAVHALLGVPAARVGAENSPLAGLQVFKRSFDARKAELLQVFIVDVTCKDSTWEHDALKRLAHHAQVRPTPDMQWHPPVRAAGDFFDHGSQRPVVVGFGPCGIFAALVLAQMGLRPIVLERGKTVRERTKDTWGLWRKHELHVESNVQFGEGGAGTFSDGKLYSQIKDPRFLGRKVMHEFVQAGAPEDILYEARPHIGTFKLVKVVENLREQIIRLGGEIRFEHRVVDVVVEPEPGSEGLRQLRALKVMDLRLGREYELPTEHAVLALGHSARDTFGMLYERGVHMQAKAFSVGFRVEHPQGVIDRARWGRYAGHPALGAADYKLVHHAHNGRSVYSFCMCPGGTVVAATSEPQRVVTNGMSQYSRNERNANAGLVVGIDPSDYPQDAHSFEWAWRETGDFLPLNGSTPHATWREPTPGQVHPLAGIVLQRQLESHAYQLGGSDYQAPGQLVGDFLAQRASTSFGQVIPSYKPGVKLGDLKTALPHYAIEALREALPAFGRKIKGFDMPDAVLTGVETRTSSPLKIPRTDTLHSTNTRGLYPAGEGASYAGGILSAGVDGIKVGEAVALDLCQQHIPAL